MSVDIHSEDAQVIRQLIPLSTIPVNQFEGLCHEITIETAARNTFLFNKNDTTDDLIYLIDGSVTLQSEKLDVETIKSGTRSSRFALAHQIPRKIDAITNTTVRFLRLSLDNINTLASVAYEEEETSYMVVDEPEEDVDDDDWMATLLKSPIFRALPPANLQQIIMGLGEVSFEKGEYILRQGESVDYYYIIKKGRCLVSRRPSPNAKEIKLAQLRNQDTFGEDSLISQESTKVNVMALTDITLHRLNKDKFANLIQEPVLHYIDYAQIVDKLEEGGILLDVRSPDEYKNYHLPKSVNIPFFTLRVQLKLFDKTKPVIIVCENGKNSAAAAFFLLRNKLNAFVVAGGMEKEPQQSKDNEADLGLQDKSASQGQFVTENKNESESVEDSSNALEEGYEQNEVMMENQRLKQLVQKLTGEKEALEKNYRLLYKQTEKLKVVLDSLRAGKGTG